MLSFYAVILVQVVLESLPVSSSGHVYLVELFFKHYYSKELIYLLHMPTLIMVLFFLRRQIFTSIKEYTHKKTEAVKLFLYVGIIDVLTALFFIFFKQFIFFEKSSAPLLLIGGFSITALLLYSLRWCTHNNHRELTLVRALILGIVQGCALIPGISRFASVYVASCWLGFSPSYGYALTWFVQLPLIGAAVAKTVCFDSWSSEYALLMREDSVIVIFLATVMGYSALVLSYQLASARRLWICAYYMIIPIVLTIFYINYYI